MFVSELKQNKSAIESYNNRLNELANAEENKEYKEEFLALQLNDITDIYDKYSNWIKQIKYKNIKLIQDDENTDQVFVTSNWNNHMFISQLTNYDVIADLIDFGVCDNASQLIKRVKELEEDSFLKEDKTYMLVLCPVFKEYQTEDHGWRWHKWGEYIGVQNRCHEYLFDEEDIDLVYCFNISEVKEKA